MNIKKIVNVSIIVPNFNNGKYLKDFIQSIIESDVYPEELIIIDDGSTDDSKSILRNFTNLQFLKLIEFDQNLGLTNALNSGLEMAKSKYIMRADSDDLLTPKRIESQFQFMENNPDIDVVGCNVIYFNNKNGGKINLSNFPLKHEEIEKVYRKGEHGIQHPTAFIKGDIYRKYKYQKIFPGEDYELFARMINEGIKFANLSESLYLMRIHSESSTSKLKYEGIRQTFEFRDNIFKTKTPKFIIYTYYQHIKYYRRFQLEENKFKKYIFLVISIFFKPSKLIKRIWK